jgi:hypothetical protein
LRKIQYSCLRLEVIESWNQIPSLVKNVKTASSFKHGYKTYKPDWFLQHKEEIERTTE